MKLGIIGLPQSGKTTLFNALTRGDRPTTLSGARVAVHTTVVDVPDPRLDRLAEIFQPQKVVPAKITYADIAGLDGSAAQSGISGELLNELAPMDGFLHVVRCFQNEAVPHLAGAIDPPRDIAAMHAELILNDLIAVERKLERLAVEWGKGGRARDLIEAEQALFRRLAAALEEEQPLRALHFTPEERRALASFGFLSLKPMLIVLNLGEGQAPPTVDAEAYHSQVVALQGQLEMELAQLSPQEAEIFLAEYGIQELGLHRMIHLSHGLLGLLTFFTADEKGVYAWTVPRGALAPEAAGQVHSDMQRGFIRAEVISFAELDSLGSLAEARKQGKLRLEGKDYVVQEGDLIRVRFNV